MPFELVINSIFSLNSRNNSWCRINLFFFQDRPQPVSNPPVAGTTSFLEGLALESVVDMSSIPSAYSTQSSEDDEDANVEGPTKRPRKEVDPDEVTSSLSGSGHKEKSSEPIFVTPLASMPPPTRMFSLNTRYSSFYSHSSKK